DQGCRIDRPELIAILGDEPLAVLKARTRAGTCARPAVLGRLDCGAQPTSERLTGREPDRPTGSGSCGDYANENRCKDSCRCLPGARPHVGTRDPARDRKQRSEYCGAPGVALWQVF